MLVSKIWPCKARIRSDFFASVSRHNSQQGSADSGIGVHAFFFFRRVRLANTSGYSREVDLPVKGKSLAVEVTGY